MSSKITDPVFTPGPAEPCADKPMSIMDRKAIYIAKLFFSTLAGGLIGAGIGFAVGGPVGLTLGFFAGLGTGYIAGVIVAGKADDAYEHRQEVANIANNYWKHNRDHKFTIPPQVPRS
jgi:hypothetical protein